jgi:Sec-independent protein secretion pathway component TatC
MDKENINIIPSCQRMNFCSFNKHFYRILTTYGILVILLLCFSSYTKKILQWLFIFTTGENISFISGSLMQDVFSNVEISMVISFIIYSPILFGNFWRYIFGNLNKEWSTLGIFWRIYSRISFVIGAVLFLFVLAPVYFFKGIAEIQNQVLVNIPHPAINFSYYTFIISFGMLFTGFLYQGPTLWLFLNVREKMHREKESYTAPH